MVRNSNSNSSNSNSNSRSDSGTSKNTIRSMIRMIGMVIPPLYVGWRVMTANEMPIMDCDEVYNYWEPLHFIMFEAGFQTWEYANVFALRTYAFLVLPWKVLAQSFLFLLHLLHPSTPSTPASAPGIAFSPYQYPETVFPSSLWWIRLLLPKLMSMDINNAYSQQDNINGNQNDHHISYQNDAYLFNDRLLLFWILRSTLAGSMAVAELLFCRAIYFHRSGDDTANKNKIIAWVTGALLFTSAGMSHAAGSFLPSSLVMCLWLHAATAFLNASSDHSDDNGGTDTSTTRSTSGAKHLYRLQFSCSAIFATLALGWPFGVLVFVPLGLHILFFQVLLTTNDITSSNNNRQRQQQPKHSMQLVSVFKFLLQVLGITLIMQGIVMIIDYQYYGKWVSPIWNIFIYNTKAGGDELYGIEPWTYYVKNLFLNFNYLLIGIVGWPIFVICQWMYPKLSSVTTAATKPSSPSSSFALAVLLFPTYLWLAIVTPRPHKEERFLFPIYPGICLAAAMLSVEVIWILIHICQPFSQAKGDCGGLSATKYTGAEQAIASTKKKTATTQATYSYSLLVFLLTMLWTPSVLISWSRSFALSKYYTAPLIVYTQLHSMLVREEVAKKEDAGRAERTRATTTICTCGEWYRFPSSFYLPSSSSSGSLESPRTVTHLGFVQSPAFQGQLPQPFTEEGSAHDATVRFNDLNSPEPASYTNIDDCDYLVDIILNRPEDSPYEETTRQSQCYDQMLSVTQRSNDLDADSSNDKENFHTSNEWILVTKVPFLDAERTSTLHRILYLPFLHERDLRHSAPPKIVYSDYVVFRRKDKVVER